MNWSHWAEFSTVRLHAPHVAAEDGHEPVGGLRRPLLGEQRGAVPPPEDGAIAEPAHRADDRQDPDDDQERVVHRGDRRRPSGSSRQLPLAVVARGAVVQRDRRGRRLVEIHEASASRATAGRRRTAPSGRGRGTRRGLGGRPAGCRRQSSRRHRDGPGYVPPGMTVGRKNGYSWRSRSMAGPVSGSEARPRRRSRREPTRSGHARSRTSRRASRHSAASRPRCSEAASTRTS